MIHGAKVIEQDKNIDTDQIDLIMFKNLYRNNISGANPKCFHSTKNVMIVDNHLPRNCLGGQSCINKLIKEDVGYFLHYRHNKLSKQNAIFDNVILKYKYLLTNRVINQLNKIYR